MNRLALLASDVDQVERLLAHAAPLEQGCFLLLRRGRGARGNRFVACDLMMPSPGDWESQRFGQLRPSPQFISAAVSRAVTADAGLLFVHSHPDPMFPADFSPTDVDALTALGQAIGTMLDGPFAAAIVHPTGWTASEIRGGDFHPVDRIVAQGRILRVLSVPAFDNDVRDEEPAGVDDRQQDALGDVHTLLRQLDIAVVGVGGLGSPIAEQLVRMGVRELTLIDSDVLDTSSNVRRVFGSTTTDLNATTPIPKVDVVGRHLDSLGMTTLIRRVRGDVRVEEVFRELLDADVVICGTDTHGSRAVMNDLPSAYLLPVIDMGVQAGAKMNGALASLAAEIRVLTPVTPCLWCRGSISGDVIRMENLPSDQRDQLAADGYLNGHFGEPAPSVVALTVLGAGLGACALIALLSEEGGVGRSGFVIDGLLGDAIEVGPTEPAGNCRCRHQLGRADTDPPPFLESQSA